MVPFIRTMVQTTTPVCGWEGNCLCQFAMTSCGHDFAWCASRFPFLPDPKGVVPSFFPHVSLHQLTEFMDICHVLGNWTILAARSKLVFGQPTRSEVNQSVMGWEMKTRRCRPAVLPVQSAGRSFEADPTLRHFKICTDWKFVLRVSSSPGSSKGKRPI